MDCPRNASELCNINIRNRYGDFNPWMGAGIADIGKNRSPCKRRCHLKATWGILIYRHEFRNFRDRCFETGPAARRIRRQAAVAITGVSAGRKHV